ncbi:hypothetical protein ACE10W_05220 [Bradyrhizobium sp. B025]|uniref:hypothetical protein n=1 Tax=Bradyrhizobium sp. B025 TaxID=3344829 RepID=UPI0035D52191
MNHPDIDIATRATTVSGQPQELQMYVAWSILNELYGLIVWLQSGLGTGASMIGFAEASREDLIGRETAAELATALEIPRSD